MNSPAKKNTRILLVEDEAALITMLRDRLRKEGFDVAIAKDGNAGLEMALRDEFNLILLDVMLPGQSGLSVCQKIRATGSAVPILMLTARRQTVDKVAGLRTGADDYLTKPFQMAELLARIDALIRRSGSAVPFRDQHRFDDLFVDLRKAEVKRDGHVIQMSAKEFQLLRYFIEHMGALVSRDELLREVWGYGVVPSSRTVDVHVAALRQKLEKDPRNPRLISTIVGLGYRFGWEDVRSV